jgi:hypothetical protein
MSLRQTELEKKETNPKYDNDLRIQAVDFVVRAMGPASVSCLSDAELADGIVQNAKIILDFLQGGHLPASQ